MPSLTVHRLGALLATAEARQRWGVSVVLGAVDAGRATRAGWWEGGGLRRYLSRGDYIPCVERLPCGLNFEASPLVVMVDADDALTGTVTRRRVRTLSRSGAGGFVADFMDGHDLDFSIEWLTGESELEVEGLE